MEPISTVTTAVHSGSLLLARSETPLASGATLSLDVETRHINDLVIDVLASHTCTVQVVRLPDGATEGEASTATTVPAATPKLYTYSDVQCHSMRIKVVNTSGSAMTSFALYVRGAA